MSEVVKVWTFWRWIWRCFLFVRWEGIDILSNMPNQCNRSQIQCSEAALSYHFINFDHCYHFVKEVLYLRTPQKIGANHCQPLFLLLKNVACLAWSHGSLRDRAFHQVACLWASQRTRGSSHCFTTRRARGDHRAMGLGPLKPAGERPESHEPNPKLNIDTLPKTNIAPENRPF